MSAWFRKKGAASSRSAYAPEILRGIHTMENDLRGELPVAPVTPSDPLVAFQPQTASTEGAPFYTDPSLVASQSQAAPLGDTGTQNTSSPFLTEDSAPPAPQTAPTFDMPAYEPKTIGSFAQSEETALSINQDEISLSQAAPFDLKQTLKRFWWVGAALLLILVLGGAAWWWFTRPVSEETPMAEAPVQSPQPNPEITAIPTEPTKVHYSVQQPNLLSFDTETVTTSDIRTEFLKIALSIKEDKLIKPAEFLIRDQNYNPLAFSRFAYLLGLGLSPELLTALDEDFSLFFFLDRDMVRIGLVVSVKNSEAFAIALARDETALPKALEPLFLDTTTAPKTGLTFRSGLYREQPVRYVNIDQTLNLSIDSAVRADEWFLGTSQATLRALLDRPTTSQ